MLKDNLKNVEERVQEACDRAGRKREEVTLIAVSKTKPIEMLQEIYDENIRDFGENKVQELCDKIEKMAYDRTSAEKQSKIHCRTGCTDPFC